MGKAFSDTEALADPLLPQDTLPEVADQQKLKIA